MDMETSRTHAYLENMKAYVQTSYGGPEALELRELEDPTPKADEVRVRVFATSVNKGDWYSLTGTPLVARFEGGLWGPRPNFVPGHDVAGVVERVGADVKGLSVGDAVYGEVLGAFGELVCARERDLAPMPKNLDFEGAATLPVAGLTALQGIAESGGLRPGQRVLINGASGGVGTLAVQIARALGGEVTGVCSTANVERARTLGADHVVDYTREDFTDTEQRYDVIFDLAGSKPFRRVRRLLTPTGVLVSSSSNLGYLFQTAVASLFTRRVEVLMTQRGGDQLRRLTELVESGKVQPVIQERFTFEHLPEALSQHGRGHARGKSVVAVAAACGARVSSRPAAATCSQTTSSGAASPAPQ